MYQASSVLGQIWVFKQAILRFLQGVNQLQANRVLEIFRRAGLRWDTMVRIGSDWVVKMSA